MLAFPRSRAAVLSFFFCSHSLCLSFVISLYPESITLPVRWEALMSTAGCSATGVSQIRHFGWEARSGEYPLYLFAHRRLILPSHITPSRLPHISVDSCIFRYCRSESFGIPVVGSQELWNVTEGRGHFTTEDPLRPGPCFPLRVSQRL